MDYAPVKGMHDVYGEEALKTRYIEQVLAAAAELYGYREIIPPVLEYTEVFARGAGESSDIVRKEMYTFLDKGGRSVTLRPEFTAGVVRAVVSNKLCQPEDLPLKLYYAGPAFRYERPQAGRFRQFSQFGVEEIGLDSAYADAECILLAMQSLTMLGFGKLTLKVNSLGDEASRSSYREALAAYFGQHIDEMCDDCHERLRLNPLRILDCKVAKDQAIAKGAPKIKEHLSAASEKRFYETLSLLNDFGIAYEIDESLVRGLDYYSEIVFEIHAGSEEGADLGALLGGGHYGGLVKEFGGPDLPGVGFAMGVERLFAAAESEGLLKDLAAALDVYVMPIGEQVWPRAFELTEECRMLGYATEMPFESLKMAAMFRKAERRKARFALILGDEEVAQGVAQLKNLATKEQKTIRLEALEKELDAAFAPYDKEEEGEGPEEKASDGLTEKGKKEN